MKKKLILSLLGAGLIFPGMALAEFTWTPLVTLKAPVRLNTTTVPAPVVSPTSATPNLDAILSQQSATPLLDSILVGQGSTPLLDNIINQAGGTYIRTLPATAQTAETIQTLSTAADNWAAASGILTAGGLAFTRLPLPYGLNYAGGATLMALGYGAQYEFDLQKAYNNAWLQNNNDLNNLIKSQYPSGVTIRDGVNLSCTTANSSSCTTGKVAHLALGWQGDVGGLGPGWGTGWQSHRDAQYAAVVTGFINGGTAYQTVSPLFLRGGSVDFENTQLAEVVQFITAKTHVKFVFDGLGTNPITWQEFDVPVFDLVKSFERVLKSSGVNFTYSDGCILLTKRMPQSELERLDFAISEKGTFFLYRGKVYEASTLLCSLRRINGQWFAVAAGSGTGNQGDQLPAIAGFGRLELTAQK